MGEREREGGNFAFAFWSGGKLKENNKCVCDAIFFDEFL